MNTRSAIKRIVVIAIVLAIGAYLVSEHLKKKAKERAEEDEAQKIEQAIRSSVDQMVLRFNAVNDWARKLLQGEEVRVQKIFTVELERLWFGQNPILFIGTIKDVSTIDEQFYQMRIERDLFHNMNQVLFADIGLEIKCSKQMFDSFFAKHPQLTAGLILNDGVAVVAKIDRIKTEFSTGQEGEKKEMRIGVGNCLDVVYIGNVQF